MFERIPVPTPFQVGPVNAYIAGRTLVDPGPDSEEAWSELLAALEERDLSPEDIEQVVITHPHPDHFGLAGRFRGLGARVLASPRGADIMRDFPGRLEYEQDFFVDFFERHGMARGTAQTVTGLPETFLTYSPSVETDEELTEGDAIEANGGTLRVREVLGHAEGELVFPFEYAGEQRALVGDHVLPDITPAPLLLPPREEGGERPKVLPSFNRSLDALAEEGFDLMLPGHRELIDRPTHRIEDIRAAHEERTENVAALVEDPTTAVEVMEGLFGDLPATEQFPGMSEAIGHLDVLEARGRVERREQGGLVVYESGEDE